jgi:catechol 2,3-dioxygenase-like lactoylglutathione lyase family enzyme
MTISRIDHVGINTSDFARALGFYRDLLGLRVLAESTHSDPEIAVLLGLESVELHIADLDSGDGRVVELIEYIRPKGTQVAYRLYDTPITHIAFTVDDLGAVRERLVAAGVGVISRQAVAIHDPGGAFDGATCLYLKGPDGVILELVQRPPHDVT